MVPLCDERPSTTAVADNSTKMMAPAEITGPSPTTTSPTISHLFHRSYPKFGPPHPSNLKVSMEEAPAEHLTFLFGIFMLISMAVICTLFLMKLTKASAASSAPPNGGGGGRWFGGVLPSADYSLMLWMPPKGTNSAGGGGGALQSTHRRHQTQRRQQQQKPSLLVLLRSSFTCSGGGGAPSRHERARNAIRGRNCVSVVSSSSMNALLPQSLTITPSPSSGSTGLAECASNGHNANQKMDDKISLPPPYEELEEMKK